MRPAAAAGARGLEGRPRAAGTPPIRRAALVTATLALTAVTALAGAAPVGAGHVGQDYFDLAALPLPRSSGTAVVDALETFVAAHPYRHTGSPTEIAAAEALRAEMTGLGYETTIEELALVAGAPTPLKAVTALKRGVSRPDEWILFVGHYDTIASTVWGAYDNGSGTNLMRFLARELATVPTNRSIVFAWYNGEEEGLLASRRHAAALKQAGQQITAVLGFDMVGIAWPVAVEQPSSCLCIFHGAPDRTAFKPLLEYVNFAFLGLPNDPRKVTVAGSNARNSDERSFADQGYPTLRWAGMRTAASYPAYHLPHDTLGTMVDVAGGRAFLEQGSANTLRSAYYTALALDNHPPEPAFTVAVDGLRVTLDASATADPDGDGGRLVWDLGDGTTSTGAVVTHTFARAGRYEIRLSAHDNLWDAVSRSTSRLVTLDQPER